MQALGSSTQTYQQNASNPRLHVRGNHAGKEAEQPLCLLDARVARGNRPPFLQAAA